jgi:hypothetical protein
MGLLLNMRMAQNNGGLMANFIESMVLLSNLRMAQNIGTSMANFIE